jgi:hypothetical protein
MTHNQNDESHCCPVFDPETWDRKIWEWHEKLFLKESMRVFFHIPSPITIKKVVDRMWKTAQDAGAAPELNDFILMATDTSPFHGEYYMALTKDIPGANVVKLSGKFYTRVFDGPYNAVPKWIRELKTDAARQGISFSDYYFYYTTCPKCAKKYGHNYTVAFAKIA